MPSLMISNLFLSKKRSIALQVMKFWIVCALHVHSLLVLQDVSRYDVFPFNSLMLANELNIFIHILSINGAITNYF